MYVLILIQKQKECLIKTHLIFEDVKFELFIPFRVESSTLNLAFVLLFS